MAKQRLSLFISGIGSNAVNIIDFLKESKLMEVVAVLATKENKVVQSLCESKGIQFELFSQKPIEALDLVKFCDKNTIDWIILAGFLKKIPLELLQQFPNKIINLHPALLPKYGGKGMYGMYVHETVIEEKETVSGITIHFVNQEFDEGEIIAQFETKLEIDETATSLAAKIHDLEMNYFPKIIENIITSR